MFCRNCGKQLDDRAVACMSCGLARGDGNKFCPNCGAETNPAAVVCIKCGAATKPLPAPGQHPDSGKRIAAGVLAILLGSLGIHKFVLGFTLPGVILLLVTILTCGAGGAVTGIIGLIEGIIYLTKSDEEFYQRYIVEKQQWF